MRIRHDTIREGAEDSERTATYSMSCLLCRESKRDHSPVLFPVSLSLAAPSREVSRRLCGSPDWMRGTFRVVFGGAKLVWQQAEQGGDATRQAEDWTAVVKEERVMLCLGSAGI